MIERRRNRTMCTSRSHRLSCNSSLIIVVPWLFLSSVACFLLQPAGQVGARRFQQRHEGARHPWTTLLTPRTLGLPNSQQTVLLHSLTPKTTSRGATTQTEDESWPSGHFVPQTHVKVERYSDVETKLGSRSTVFVNDTLRPALRSGIVPLSTEWDSMKDNKKLHFTMLGEFYSERPGYLHMHPVLTEGDVPRLWITDFGMVGDGGLVGIDVSGRKEACVCNTQFLWPNSIEHVPPNTFNGVNHPGVLVADGFLVPGKTDGGVYFVSDPGTDDEHVAKLTSNKKQFFYHKAVPLQIGGVQGVLTARACKPIVPFAKAEGELVWLEMPNVLCPTAPWNTPWREVVLAKGPDVMFDVVDLDPTDDSVQVFSAEFFTRRLTLHSVRWDAQSNAPKVIDSQIIDDNLGQAYSVIVADLQGRNSHLLVTTHEDTSDEQDKTRKPMFGMGAKWTYTKTPTPRDSRTLSKSSDSDGALAGGMMLAYKIPPNWRPKELLTDERALRDRLPDMFKRMDVRGEGCLAVEDFAQALRSIGTEYTDSQVREMFSQADWDGSGKIDFAEFEGVVMQAFRSEKRGPGLSMWSAAIRSLEDKRNLLDLESFKAKLPGLFARIDADSSGKIDMAEMKAAMDAMGVSCTDVELASMFVEADWDGDGTVDLNEFMALMQSFYASTRNPENLWTKALGAFESALRQTTLLKDQYIWERTTLACGFRVKRLSINPGAPGFAYPFYPHVNMKDKGVPPHILLAGDCADAAYIFRPVPKQGKVHYELMATFGFEGTVGSVAVGYLDTVDSVDDGWAKFFLGVYETDRVYMFKCGGVPVEGVEATW